MNKNLVKESNLLGLVVHTSNPRIGQAEKPYIRGGRTDTKKQTTLLYQ